MVNRRDTKKLCLYLRYENITLLAIFIIFLLALPTAAQSSNFYQLEKDLQEHFNTWQSPNYDTWDCVDMSAATKSYLEEHGIYVEMIYGHRINNEGNTVGHAWLRINIKGVMHDFEATQLQFTEVSQEYITDYIT